MHGTEVVYVEVERTDGRVVVEERPVSVVPPVDSDEDADDIEWRLAAREAARKERGLSSTPPVFASRPALTDCPRCGSRALRLDSDYAQDRACMTCGCRVYADRPDYDRTSPRRAGVRL